MTSWMKVNCIVIISLVVNTVSWAEPASAKHMHALDDSELREVSDHDHSDESSLSHAHHADKKEEPQNLSKENNQQNLRLIQTSYPK
ncbi:MULTISPECIES: hypothetical protein [Acinetobacter]|uniref:Secreted protein n=2 Tax=Acinetobacter soli TaxID=487316 RepID=A0AB38Z1P2_9GAMM|nr:MULTISPECIES: hypothetical protein [Acinetobacter]EIB6895593.1 hypothetical protein [Acinetobacter baumannii]EKV0482880.1 hypothetical protein [Acinetobacter baumannii]EKV0866748.1 hypothetical protein [Acinetobacter baumannii]EKW6896570.1 hypothetical protein [Acinetobacter baumannii]EKW9731269.1 hypothetical protein [Acinetobacter baumannii]